MSKNEYGTSVEWHWQRKDDVLGEKPVPVPIYPPQITNHRHTHTHTHAQSHRIESKSLGVPETRTGRAENWGWEFLSDVCRRTLMWGKTATGGRVFNKLGLAWTDKIAVCFWIKIWRAVKGSVCNWVVIGSFSSKFYFKSGQFMYYIGSGKNCIPVIFQIIISHI